jgi:formamidopyrimidine-DNA glycosylase
MPELPEVETTMRLIRPAVLGRRIRGTTVDWVRTLGGMSVPDFDAALRGTTIAAVSRRAKYIRLDLQRRGAPAGSLLVHLRMSGRLVGRPARETATPYTRLSLLLDRGQALDFVDVRKFGRFAFHADADAALAHLGPEPLQADFTVDWLATALRSRRRMLKPLLLDQGFLAGLGNIYVDESLFQARLHPERRADTLRRPAIRALHAAIVEILTRAVEQEGSSFDTFYRTPEGQPGAYQDQFQVYGRHGRACRRCGATVRRIVVGQRGTHLCPRCQRRPRAG